MAAPGSALPGTRGSITAWSGSVPTLSPHKEQHSALWSTAVRICMSHKGNGTANYACK